MSKKKKTKRKYNPNKALNNINKSLTPIANEIKTKMEMLAKEYNFNIDFAFPEITMEDIMNPKQ